MDAHYQEIIDMYNDRRKQKYFLSGIIIMAISLAYEIYFISCAKTKRDKKIDKGSEKSSSVGEYEKMKGKEEIDKEENKEQIKKDFEIKNDEQIEENKENDLEKSKNEEGKKNNLENSEKEEKKKKNERDERVYIRDEGISSERNFGNLKGSLKRSVNSRLKVSELYIKNQ
jgi:hypothetical protein